MKTIKTSELTGATLDWAVTQVHLACPNNVFTQYRNECNYSTDWAQSGPIMEREKISTEEREGIWMAVLRPQDGSWPIGGYGQTPLIAAMRCYVASKLGDTVEIPEDLV